VPPASFSRWSIKRPSDFPHRKIIGDAIRFRRNQAAFTQEKLAEFVSLNPKYIGEVERGEKIISIEALLRIAKVLKTPIREFFREL
jgi:transcriptional regulator with XRE-family HTH domain